MRKNFVRWSVPCAIFFLAIGGWQGAASAQQAPSRIVQGNDGTLYFVTSDTRYVVNPDPISDDDLAALADGGSMGGQLPMGPAIGQPAPTASPASPLPTDMPPPLDGPFTGAPENIMLQPSALGPGWSILDQHRDSADATTTGTLTTRFADANGSTVVARVTIFRNHAAALAGWIYGRMAGGSLNVCEASWYPESTDPSAPTPIHGECLVQNVVIGMEGAPYQLTQVQLASMGSRVTGTTTPVPPRLPTNTSVPANTPIPPPTAIPVTTVPKPKPVTIASSGRQKTAPFDLAPGNYTVSWTGTDPGGRFGGGNFSVELSGLNNAAGDFELIANVILKAGETQSGTTNAYNLHGGQYYLAVSAEGVWTVTFTPQ